MITTRPSLIPACFVSAALLSPSYGGAQPAEPIVYTLRFPAPQSHYVEVEAVVPTGRRPSLEMMMPVWTPGSYLVREFARHVESFAARLADGTDLVVDKTRKNRWRVATRGAASVVVTYRVYCREMGVRTNWVEDRFAILNGAPTFITIADDRGPRPHEVRLDLPTAWHTSFTSLDSAPGGRPHHYVSPDYDTLVDSPIVAGNQTGYAFEVAGKRHLLVNEGEAGIWDGPRSARDVERLVRTAERFWGELPYPRYVFLNLITESGGGLEHKDSTLMMTSRWRTSTRRDYVGWLGLVSHEYFHAWNVKRLRPVELGPFDYENEVYTENLWIAEGFTDYYGDLLLRRSGLSTREEYLDDLSRLIQQLQTTPGRRSQPASLSSFDAWIRQYRPDENSPNVAISYYTKGGVIAFLLDATIRRRTGGTRSLDDVMRLAFERYGGEHGYSTDQFRATASEVAGIDLGSWFEHAVDSTNELDYTEALDWFGLRFKPGEARTDRGWLGAETTAQGECVVITSVRRGTPAYDAGLDADDEVVAIDGFRVRPEQLEQRWQAYRPGQQVELLVARRGAITRIKAVLGAEPVNGWRVEVRPGATSEQLKNLRDWLWEE